MTYVLAVLIFSLGLLAGLSSPKQLNFSITDKKKKPGAKRGRPAGATTKPRKKAETQPDLPLNTPT